MVVALGHVVNHAARVADGRHGRNADSGGQGDVAGGDAVAVGTAVNAETSSDAVKSSVTDDSHSAAATATANHAVTYPSVGVSNDAVMDSSAVDDHASGGMVSESDPMANSAMSNDAMTDGTAANHPVTDDTV